jgi:hypothetical protein
MAVFFVYIRHDFAEIWGFGYGLALGIGTLKIMASTGVFVRVVCALKRSISLKSQTPSMISTLKRHKQSHSHQSMGPERDIYEGGQRTKQTERQPRTVVDLQVLPTRARNNDTWDRRRIVKNMR